MERNCCPLIACWIERTLWFVLVLEGAREEQQNEQEQKLAKAQEIARLLAAELSMKRAVALAAEIGGVRKNALYALMLRDEE